MFTLYGAPGWGSAISELMFSLCGELYRWVDVSGFDQPGEARDRLLALNPLGQVPTLQSEDGAVLTESAAIALMLADRHPALIPPHGDPQRARFCHWLVWLVAAVYPIFTYGDYPQRWTAAGAQELKKSTDAHREEAYRRRKRCRAWWRVTSCSAPPEVRAPAAPRRWRCAAAAVSPAAIASSPACCPAQSRR
ncbi:glutathione S-transferase N-terminal domain-containing protein [Pantoea sp. RRHST58]|uniref:glutathione S-transferase n=1 Tax=Pantoea sp. RRHST58 TaxID=3425183 RepID=UPI003DA18434